MMWEDIFEGKIYKPEKIWQQVAIRLLVSNLANFLIFSKKPKKKRLISKAKMIWRQDLQLLKVSWQHPIIALNFSSW